MNKQDFLTCSSLEVETLDFWLEQQWIVPEQTSAGMSFSDMDVARARLIRDLKGDFGVNDEGVDVVLHLIDQLHGLRRALTQLQEHLRGTSREAAPGPQSPQQRRSK